MAASAETRPCIDKNSPRLKHLQAPRFTTASGDVINFNRGWAFGQHVTERILGLAADLNISNLENLVPLRKQIEENEANPKKATPIWVALNHAGHLDFPKAIEALSFSMGGDLRERAFMAMGSRVAENVLIDLGTRQYQWVRTPQPYDEVADGPLTEKQLIQRGGEDLILLTQSRKAMRALFREGKFGVIAPTGTRKANHEGIPEVVHYFKSGHILPVHIGGSGEILPPGEWRPRRGTVTITFGEMYSFSELEGMYKDLPRDRQMKAQVDEVMRRIDAVAPSA
jgi:hypothetical protein